MCNQQKSLKLKPSQYFGELFVIKQLKPYFVYYNLEY